jgi:RNA polymerase sigma-70 factor (ECF subfamily)
VTVDESDWLAERFQSHRTHLHAVAFRMLGSMTEAEDAVQDAWLRLSRADTAGVENLRAWLTTVVGRVCLDMLRARKSRREGPLEPATLDGIRSDGGPIDPEREAMLADSVGLALLMVLDTLAPAERLALVLHDMFGMPFDEIAPLLGRSTAAAKKLASRARHRFRGTGALPSADLTRQRHIVEAFLAAVRGGDIDGVLAVLAPNVVRRADGVAGTQGAAREVRGAQAVAEHALANAGRGGYAQVALVNGTPGILVGRRGRLTLVLMLTIQNEKISAIDVIADPSHLRRLDLAVLERGA